MEKESEINSIVLSNSLDSLAQRLIEDLYFGALGPFQKRIVVVPDMAMKEYLVHYFLSHPRLQVCAGLEILLLNDAMTELHGCFSKKIPSSAALSLAIEHNLWSLSETGDELRSYLHVENEEKKARRIAQLSDELARLFSLYGLHGVHFLKEWLSSKENHWQKQLFCALFQSDAPWSYPIELFSTGGKSDAKIALFGFQYLSPVHLSFFSQKGASFFHLSPSMGFWGDFATDKEKISERKRLMRKGESPQKIEAMQRYLEEGHPLLNNWGKLGREMLKNLDAFTFVDEEAYEAVDSSSLLGQLKLSLLLIERLEFSQDDSIQIHSATSKLREVEALMGTIEQSSIPLRDIVVFAPDIALYAPYIEMVLAQKKCPYAIHGVPLQFTSAPVQGFVLLLEIFKTDCALAAMMALLENDSFLEKHPFSSEEIASLSRWFEEAEIRKGGEGWREGLERLLHSYAVAQEESLQKHTIQGIGPKELDLLDRFISLFYLLEEEFPPFKSKQSASAWCLWALKCAETFLSFDRGNELFFQELHSLALQVHHLKEPLWNFESIERIFVQMAQKKSAKMGVSDLDKIRFASIGPGRAAPARMIWCLGMDEGAFPRSEGKSPFSAVDDARCNDYFPSRLEEDRAVFMELLLHAKERLIFSYERINPDDHKQQSHSLLIDELNSYAMQKICLVEHPAVPFPISASLQQSPFFAPLAVDPMPQEKMRVVDLAALKKFARHPLEFYLQKKLGIYLKEERDGEEKEFVFSRIQNAVLKKSAIKGSFQKVVHYFEGQGKMPRGLFGKAALRNLSGEAAALLESLEEFDVPLEEVGALHFCKKGEHLPPLAIPLASGIVHVVGTVADITPKGLLCHRDDSVRSMVQEWPMYLAARCASTTDLPFLFAKKGKVRVVEIEDPVQAFAEYLEYFFLAQTHPSPLMPQWASSLLQKSEIEFSKEVHAEVGEDPYIHYLRQRGALDALVERYAYWSPLLRTIFAPILKGKVAHAEL